MDDKTLLLLTQALNRAANPPKEKPKPNWNSLEAVKVIVSLLVPLAIAFSGYWIQQEIRAGETQKAREAVVAEIFLAQGKVAASLKDIKNQLRFKRDSIKLNEVELSLQRLMNEHYDKEVVYSLSASRLLFNGDRRRFDKYYEPVQRATFALVRQIQTDIEAIAEAGPKVRVVIRPDESGYAVCVSSFMKVLDELLRYPNSTDTDMSEYAMEGYKSCPTEQELIDQAFKK